MESFALLFATTTLILLVMLLTYLKRSLNYWKVKRIPYLEPTLPFGNLKSFITNKISQGVYFKHFYEELKKMETKCGGVYAFHLPVLVPIAPDCIKNILVKHFDHFQARDFYTNEKLQPISVNLFTVDGEKWRSLRTKLTPTFTSAKMKNLFYIMLECGKTMEEYVSKQVRSDRFTIDIKDCVGRLTTDIIGSCAFGINCESFRSKETYFHYFMMNLITKATSSFRFIFLNTFPKVARFFDVPLFPRNSEGFFCKSIDETLQYRAATKISREDFLDMLIELKNKDVINLDDIKAQCLMFFIAGYETSATVLMYGFFELACNQNIQDKLRAEIVQVLSRHDNAITYEAVSEMKYLTMVLEETLRKYPVVPVLFRKCVKEYPVPETSFVIDKGTSVIVPVLGLHYDPEYFPNPEKFDPSRFSEENKENIVPYTYLPFGYGPRNCIGSRFGLLQTKIGMVSLLRKYRVTLNSEVKVPLNFSNMFFLTPSQSILLDFKPVNN